MKREAPFSVLEQTIGFQSKMDFPSCLDSLCLAARCDLGDRCIKSKCSIPISGRTQIPECGAFRGYGGIAASVVLGLHKEVDSLSLRLFWDIWNGKDGSP